MFVVYLASLQKALPKYTSEKRNSHELHIENNLAGLNRFSFRRLHIYLALNFSLLTRSYRAELEKLTCTGLNNTYENFNRWMPNRKTPGDFKVSGWETWINWKVQNHQSPGRLSQILAIVRWEFQCTQWLCNLLLTFCTQYIHSQERYGDLITATSASRSHDYNV